MPRLPIDSQDSPYASEHAGSVAAWCSASFFFSAFRTWMLACASMQDVQQIAPNTSLTTSLLGDRGLRVRWDALPCRAVGGHGRVDMYREGAVMAAASCGVSTAMLELVVVVKAGWPQGDVDYICPMQIGECGPLPMDRSPGCLRRWRYIAVWWFSDPAQP